MTAKQNIHPRFDRTLSRSAKERMLKQRARVIWLTGLSGSGKTTIAHELEKALVAKGFFAQLLDGDNVRAGINNNLGFSEEDRRENIRRIAEVSKLFLNCGIICINSFISPTKAIRQMAYDIIGREDVIEIFVNAPLETCEQRDTKGLYEKARAGLIKDFTGISSPYEAPESPDVLLDTGRMSIDECVASCADVVMAKVLLK